MSRKNPFHLALDSWALGLESGAVIGLRLPRLMTGDAAALAEAQLMVSEKLAAAAALHWKMMTGGLGTTPHAVMSASVAHYRKGVRKNRRRLGEKPKV